MKPPGPVEEGDLLYRWTNHSPDALFQARVALRRAAEKRGLSDDVIWLIASAAGELMANAVEHARGPYELYAWWKSTEVVCGVVDHEPCIPDTSSVLSGVAESNDTPTSSLDDLKESGRGLNIVHKISQGSWGFTAHGSTKIAWCVITLE